MDNKKGVLLTSKTIIRSKNFEASKNFYTQLLGLKIIEEWNGDELSGCIVQVGEATSTAFIEIQEVDFNNELLIQVF